jgi:triacylglycerol lipase
MASKGISKVNIVAHSHGTIYTRYAMTNLGMGTKVASYTSLCGPHRGSAVADVLFNVVGDKGGWLLGATLDVVYALVFGDIHPNSLQNGKDLLRSYMINTFNPNTPNVAGIYYQSYATRNTLLVTNDVVLTPTYLLLNYYEGVNDGLVSETSAKWGTYRGMQSGTWIFGGVSHLNAVNQFMGITPGFDAPGWICGIVNDLKTKGY